MTKHRCGNDPRAQLTDGDRQAVTDFKAYLQQRADGRGDIVRYRKRPVEVDTIRWTGDNEQAVQAFTGTANFHALDPADRENCDDPEATAEVYDRLHSTWVLVYTGQHIVRGVKGEFYPIAEDVLAETYEPVDAASAVVAPPTDQAAAEAVLAAVETALGDTLTADAREEALAGIAAVLPAPADQAAVRDALRRADDAEAKVERYNRAAVSAAALSHAASEKLRRSNAWLSGRVRELEQRTDRAAVLREAADAVFALEYDVMVGEEGDENLGSMREAWDVGTIHASQLLRHMADQAQPEPGARHVHITIHHPDPTTANTAAHAVADLIRGEYGDSLHLTITTDARDTGAAPSRPAGETPDTTPQPTAAEEHPADAARRFARRLFAVERLCSGRPGYHTLTVKQVLTAISDACEQPAAARQDGAQP